MITTMMLRKLFAIAWCLWILAGANSYAEVPANAPVAVNESPLITRARKVLETMKVTTYVHTTDIKEDAGEYHCDCSGLITYLLKKELPAHYKAVVFPVKFKHPRASDFTDWFASLPAQVEAGKLWHKVENLTDAKAGDLLAWRKDPVPPTGNTGHIVLIDGAPKRVAEGIYSVEVIDSTTAGHENDTRKKGETGVGRGTIYVKVDAAGRPVARAARSQEGPWTESPTAIGRTVIK